MHGIGSRCERPSHQVDSQRRGFRNSRSRRGFDRCAAVVSHHAQGVSIKRLVALPAPLRRWPISRGSRAVANELLRRGEGEEL
jgi:hypothetical protein